MILARYCQYVAFSVFLLIAPPSSMSGDMVTLKIDYPPPALGATAKLPDENVECSDGREAPATLLVPSGTTNVALNKSVTSSSGTTNLYANLVGRSGDKTTISVGGPTNLNWITSGDKTSPLGRDMNFLWVGSRIQWVQIDLEAEVDIYAVAVWHCYYIKNVVFNNVVVQICSKPDFQENVSTIFNNDTKNELGLGAGADRLYCETRWGKLIDAKGIKGRYVRLYSNGSNLGKINYYLQVEVYGK
jgi:hypothetical protein